MLTSFLFLTTKLLNRLIFAAANTGSSHIPATPLNRKTLVSE